MKTPLQMALERLPDGPFATPNAAPLTPLGAMYFWAKLFGLTFLGLFVCSIIASGGSLILISAQLPIEQHILVMTTGSPMLILTYCLGNILLIQGLPGARWAHSALAACALLITLVAGLKNPIGWLFWVSLAACLGGLALSNCKRYRAMLSLHAMIRQLRRQHGLQRRIKP